MTTPRSPYKSHTSTNQGPVTLDHLYSTMVANFTQIRNSQSVLQSSVDQLKATQESILQRLGNVEALTESLSTSQSELNGEVKALKDDAREQYQKLLRMSNIILMGVPETDAGLQLANNLLNFLHSEWKGPIVDRRVGDPTQNQGKPRPLRIPVKHSLMRDEIIFNCSKLKGKAEFAGISVRRDLTKKEQLEWRNQGELRRSQRKRKSNSGNSQDPNERTRKQAKGTDDNMEI